MTRSAKFKLLRLDHVTSRIGTEVTSSGEATWVRVPTVRSQGGNTAAVPRTYRDKDRQTDRQTDGQTDAEIGRETSDVLVVASNVRWT